MWLPWIPPWSPCLLWNPQFQPPRCLLLLCPHLAFRVLLSRLWLSLPHLAFLLISSLLLWPPLPVSLLLSILLLPVGQLYRLLMQCWCLIPCRPPLLSVSYCHRLTDGLFSCVVKSQKRRSKKIYKTELTKIIYNNQVLCKYRVDPQRARLTLIAELTWSNLGIKEVLNKRK